MYVITGRTGGGRQLSHLHLPTERAKNEVWLGGASADHRHVGGRSNYVVFALQIQEVCHATELCMSVCGALQRARFLLTYLIFNKYYNVLCAVLIWFTAPGLLSGHEHNSDMAVMVCLLLEELMETFSQKLIHTLTMFLSDFILVTFVLKPLGDGFNETRRCHVGEQLARKH